MKFWKAYVLALGFVLLVGAATTLPSQLWFKANGTGAVLRKQSEKLFEAVTPQDYGAVCDGSTDDAPAIRNAIAAAGVGGRVRIPGCPLPYMLNSYDGTTWQGHAIMFYPLEGQTIQADYGAQLKVANSILNTGLAPGGGSIFNILTKTHVTLDGIRVDMNGANNQTPVGGFHPAWTFIGEGGSYNTIKNTETLNSPGRNAITIFGCSRGNCPTQWNVISNVTRNGGTSLTAGNPNQNDWSAIYVESTYASIQNNTVLNDNYTSASIPNNGGIEIHGNFTVASGNELDKSNPAFYIGSNVSGQDVTDIVVSSNIITNALTGLTFYPISLTDNYGRVAIVNNTIMLKLFSGFSSQPVGVSMQRNNNAIFPTGPGLLYDSEIANNVISSTTSSTDSSVAMSLSQTKNTRIHDNMMSQLGDLCINLLGAPLGHTDAVLDANICKDYALTSPGGTRMAFDMDSLNDRPPLRTVAVVALHQWVRPTTNNGFTYDATTAGTTSGAEPTWPVVLGNTVTDGTVVWTARAAWPYNGIVMRNNVFSQTTTRASYTGVYMTNDLTASPPMTFANITVGPNLTHGIGNVTLGAPAPKYVDQLSGTVTMDQLRILTGIAGGIPADGAGFKHKRGTAGCTTAAAAGALCTTTVTWTSAFADANYTVACTGAGINAGTPALVAYSAKVAASVTVQTMAVTAIASQFATIECEAVHD